LPCRQDTVIQIGLSGGDSRQDVVVSGFQPIAQNSHPLLRFWQASRQFWFAGRVSVTGLAVLLFAVMLLQLLVQVLLNLWNRGFFDALERRDAHTLWVQTKLFFPLARGSILLAATSVWGRMTAQRKWREAMTRAIVKSWTQKRHDFPIESAIDGTENPEYRLAEDVRIATDAPVDMVLAFISSALTAVTFFDVLWNVGGDISFELLGRSLSIPGYLVIGVIVYSTIMTTLMLVFGQRMTGVIESKNQAEAEFRAAAEILRGGLTESRSATSDEHRTLLRSLQSVLRSWRELCWQLTAATLVSHANFLFAPVAAYVLCVPKYLTDAMTLGEVTQSAAAFVTVRGAMNWLVDNYQRLADWRSSAHRVAALLLAIDNLQSVPGEVLGDSGKDGSSR
jgi:putative ATP-binding cassette transporter